MTPKEQARELVHIFYISLPNNGGFTGLNNINSRWEEGKKCALIAVDEILNIGCVDIEYWVEVKTEIEKI